jgi:hypothetical protein
MFYLVIDSLLITPSQVRAWLPMRSELLTGVRNKDAITLSDKIDRHSFRLFGISIANLIR